MHENGVLLRSKPTIVMTRRDYVSPRRSDHLGMGMGMGDLLQEFLNARLVVMGLRHKDVNRGIIED